MRKRKVFPVSVKPVYSMEEAAQVLNLGRNSMYNLVLSGKVSSFKVGARRLVSHQALLTFINQVTQ